MIYDEKKRQKAVKSKAYSDKNSHQESAFDNSYNKRMKIKQEVYSTNSDNNMFTVPMPNKHTNNMGFKPIHQQNQQYRQQSCNNNTNMMNHGNRFMNNMQFENSSDQQSSLSNILNMQGENINHQTNPASDPDFQNVLSHRTNDILPQFKVAALLLAQTIKQMENVGQQNVNQTTEQKLLDIQARATPDNNLNNSNNFENNSRSGNTTIQNNSNVEGLDLFASQFAMIGNPTKNGEKVKIKVPFCLKCNSREPSHVSREPSHISREDQNQDQNHIKKEQSQNNDSQDQETYNIIPSRNTQTENEDTIDNEQNEEQIYEQDDEPKDEPFDFDD